MSDAVETTSPSWWQIITVGRNPRTTLIRLTVTAVLVYVGFHVSIQPIRVSGISMAPSYRDGESKFVNKLAYRMAPPRRGDVVAIRDAGRQVLLLKRVIALPGEKIRIFRGTVFINGEPLDEPYLKPPGPGVRNPAAWNISEIQLDPNEHYVIGDNRSMRQEDHYFGRVDDARIIGRLISP